MALHLFRALAVELALPIKTTYVCREEDPNI